MSSKIKLDFQIVHNKYYRIGMLLIVITLLINILTNYEIISTGWKVIRLIAVLFGIPLYFYGTFVHYKKSKDFSFIKQTLVGFLIGLFIIAYFL